MREKPLLRLEDRSHIAPFRLGGALAAYLPPDEPTDYPIVARSIASDPDARRFLANLGLREPDLFTEVTERILPIYASEGEPTLSETADLHNVEKIVRTLNLVGPRERVAWFQRLKAIPFLRATNAESGRTAYKRPIDVYVPSEGLALYFQGNDGTWFLAPAYEALADELGALGVSREVRVRARPANEQGHVVLHREHGYHERGLHGFDPDCTVDGLEHALDTITAAKAAYIWNDVLRPHRCLIRGVVETATRQSYEGATQHARVSLMGALVSSRGWLPTESGRFAQPGELSADDLAVDFTPDAALAEALGLRQTSPKTLSQETGYSVAELDYLLQHRGQVAAYLKALTEAEKVDGGDDGPDTAVDRGNEPDTSVVDFGAGLVEILARPARGAALGPDIPGADGAGSVTNPEKRLEKIKSDILQERLKDPREPRFSQVPRRIWGARDSVVRTFLREQYHGHCQNCDDTFPLRDGTPYFEGLTLVSRRGGAWLDRPGNVLCLCATCCAKMQYGEIEAGDILEQIRAIPVTTLGHVEPTLRI